MLNELTIESESITARWRVALVAVRSDTVPLTASRVVTSALNNVATLETLSTVAATFAIVADKVTASCSKFP